MWKGTQAANNKGSSSGSGRSEKPNGSTRRSASANVIIEISTLFFSDSALTVDYVREQQMPTTTYRLINKTSSTDGRHLSRCGKERRLYNTTAVATAAVGYTRTMPLSRCV